MKARYKIFDNTKFIPWNKQWCETFAEVAGTGHRAVHSDSHSGLALGSHDDNMPTFPQFDKQITIEPTANLHLCLINVIIGMIV